MSGLDGRIERLERAIGAGPCPDCSGMPEIVELRPGQEEPPMPPPCPRCWPPRIRRVVVEVAD